MKNNIGFLGLGAAGSNICEVAEAHNFRTAIMNTSPEDLNSIENIKNKLLVGNKGGAGKNRNTAKADVKNYYKDIIEFVKNKFADDNIKLIYVVFATSGGTGSGMSPMVIDVLSRTFPNKKFGAIAVIPDLSESPIAQYNCLENLNELSRLNIPTLLIDNEKFVRKEQKLSKKQFFDTINKAIINDFESLFKERQVSKYGNLDARDLMTLLLTPGVTLISTFRVNGEGYDMNSFNKKLMLSWDKSIYADLEYDRVIKRMGFIYEVSDTITKSINVPFLEKEVGKALEVFEGYYTPTNNESSVVSFLTGLSYPEKRIRQINEIVEKSKEEINLERKKVDILNKDSSSWFSDSRDDIFGFGNSEGISSLDATSNSGELDLDKLFGQY